MYVNETETRGTAMSLTAATSGFLIFLLTVPVVQGQYGWGVTYTPTWICALKGSTVNIRCSYRYPIRINDRDTEVERKLWFTKLQDKEPVDLRTDSDYAGRVQYHCDKNDCTLRITDLRESDSAEYKFKFITNQPGGRFTGSRGVTLTVTDLQVTVRKRSTCKTETCTWAELSCHSICKPAYASYIWYKNGEKIGRETSSSYSAYFYPADSYSCAVKGYERYSAPSVCGHGQSCNRVTYTDRSICAFRGSSVDISCTYNSYGSITSTFWFNPDRSHQWQNPSQPEDLRKDSQYAGRVQLLKTKRGRFTLRISDLRKSDSAQYHFTFTTRSFEWRSSLPGTTLTVTDPDVQVQVFLSSTGPKLICLSSCPPGHSSYTWYKNEEKIQEETSSYRGSIDPTTRYSCALKGHRSVPVYAPKFPSVLMSLSDNIMEGSSVTLTCSSDANPAAKHTWYKKNVNPDLQPLSKEPQLVFSSIQSSDSGEYYCTAENQLGKRTSEHIFIDVRYAPKLPSVSVSPSGEIAEGSSVTLTCRSDANPAANYTWYKENQIVNQGQQGSYHLTCISSEASGIYHCKSENQFGQNNSSSLSLDVQYAPKLPSVSVSPSGEIVEGSSVNLTCSSDANPAANYTWYKENEDSPKASGQMFTILHFRREHNGNYSCEAQNIRGRHNSTLYLTLVEGAYNTATIGTITTLLLAIILVIVFLWIKRKRSSTQQSEPRGSTDNRAQLSMGPVNDSPSAAAQSEMPGQEDDLHYASVSFSQDQSYALYANIRPAQRLRQTEEEEEDDVEYSNVKVDSANCAQGTRQEEAGDELFALYSTVNKKQVNTT